MLQVINMTYAIRGIAMNFRKISKTIRTKSQNLNDSRLVLHLSLPNLLKPDAK